MEKRSKTGGGVYDRSDHVSFHSITPFSFYLYYSQTTQASFTAQTSHYHYRQILQIISNHHGRRKERPRDCLRGESSCLIIVWNEGFIKETGDIDGRSLCDGKVLLLTPYSNSRISRRRSRTSPGWTPKWTRWQSSPGSKLGIARGSRTSRR